MFTFYPPLRAHWAFYVGLTLVVVGTWLVTLNLVLTYRTWWAQHAEERTPLAAFMALVTFAMWSIASLGLAAEMLGMLIPWSLGWQTGTDPLLARTLFWFSGHPIVYFWLLPTYVSWYTLIPRQAGGRLFSDPMARASFMLFLLLSTPVGLHHQFTDPGIGQGWKLLHAFLTFAVFFPSLLTFFNVVASLRTRSGSRPMAGSSESLGESAAATKGSGVRRSQGDPSTRAGGANRVLHPPRCGAAGCNAGGRSAIRHDPKRSEQRNVWSGQIARGWKPELRPALPGTCHDNRWPVGEKQREQSPGSGSEPTIGLVGSSL
jgi:hypothetical protein